MEIAEPLRSQPDADAVYICFVQFGRPVVEQGVIGLAVEDVPGSCGSVACGVLTQHPILSGNSPGGSLLREVRFCLVLPNGSLSNSMTGGWETSEYGRVGAEDKVAWGSGTDRDDMPANVCRKRSLSID